MEVERLAPSRLFLHTCLFHYAVTPIRRWSLSLPLKSDLALWLALTTIFGRNNVQLLRLGHKKPVASTWRASLKPPCTEADPASCKIRGLTEANQSPPANSQEQLPNISEGIRNLPGQPAVHAAMWVSPGKETCHQPTESWEIINKSLLF